MLSGVVTAPAVAAILIGFDQYQSRGSRWKRAVVAGTLAFTILVGIRAAHHVWVLIRDLPEWDFQALWLPARVAAMGHNFYDPVALRAAVPPSGYSPQFIRECVEIGFLYPPWSMLFLAPLGRFAAAPAGVIWGAVEVLALLASIIALWKAFDTPPGWLGFLFTTALVLSLSPTQGNLAYGQVNFLMLLPLALYWKKKDGWDGGGFLALASVWKPLGGFILLGPLLQRSWRVLAGTTIVLATIGLATVWRFGWTLSKGYFTSNLAGRFPRDVYINGPHQSILAAILRTEPWEKLVAMANPVLHPIYLAVAALFIFVSALLVILLRERDRDLSLAILIPCGLLVYPMTFTPSGVLLILPLLYLWQNRKVHGVTISFVLITAVYALLWFDDGHKAVLGYLTLWAGLVLLALHGLRTAPTLQPTSKVGS